MNRSLLAGILVGTAVLGIGIGVAGMQAESKPPENTRNLPVIELQAILDKQVEKGMPGIVMRVENGDGAVWAGASGVSSLGGAPMSPSSRQPIFSITKMVVAAATLSLVEDGKVGLDDPVVKWLSPATIAGLDNADRITVRHLLTQTGGIRDYWDEAFIDQVVADTDRQWRPEELVAHAAKGDAVARPDDGYSHYSNTNYILLGLVIEKATGSPLAAVLRERVLTPMGMTQTAMWEEGVLRPQTSGYMLMGGDLVDVTGVDLSISWAAGGLVSTARDVSLLMKGIFEGGILSDATRSTMMSTFAPMKGKDGIDYGLGVARVTAFGPEVFGHLGDGPGYGALTLYEPSSRTSIVVLMNAESEAHISTFTEVMALLKR